MNKIIVFFISLASFLFANHAWSASQTLEQELILTTQGRVSNIIAADTLQLEDGSIIRLSGIQLPSEESHNTASSLLDSVIEIEKDMLLNQEVNIYQSKDPKLGRINRMGHKLAHIQRLSDGLWLQGMLLNLGLAHVKTTQRNTGMADAMYALEALAREEKIGLWEDAALIKHASEVSSIGGGFQIVEGKIESVAMHNNRLYINFGKNWRDDFTVSISATDQRHFAQAGHDPLQWGGKIIRVRGWVRDYNGPYMEIDHPQAIEFIEPSPTQKP